MAIPRLHKEASIFDEQNPISGGIDDAAKCATDYITEISGDGIWVTPEDAKPGSDGQATGATTGWHISGALEYFKAGASWFKLWLNTALNKMQLRLGLESSGHVVLDDSGMEVLTDASTSVASFGASSRIGSSTGARIVTTSSGFDVYNSSNQKKASYGVDQYFYGGNGDYPYVKASSNSVGVYLSQTLRMLFEGTTLNYYSNDALGMMIGIPTGATYPLIRGKNYLALFAVNDISNPTSTTSLNIQRYSTPGGSYEGKFDFRNGNIDMFDCPITDVKSITFDSFIRTGSSTDGVGLNKTSSNSRGLYRWLADEGWLHYVNGNNGMTYCFADYFYLKGSSGVTNGPYLYVASDSNNTPYVTSSRRLYASSEKAGIGGDDNYIYFYSSTDDTLLRFSKSTGHMQAYIDGSWSYRYWRSDIQRTSKTVLAAPSDADGVASFRNLVTTDINNLGTVANTDLGAKSNFNSGSWAEVRATSTTNRVKLAAGTWVVTMSVSFSSNATGRRMAAFTIEPTPANVSINRTTVASFSIPAATGEQTKNTVTTIVQPNSETTYYVHAYQNSGSALTVGAYVRAVRIR